jgi:hypothetical protein
MGWLYDISVKINSGKHEYKIRIRGHLDHHWHTWFEGWTITELENGETLFTNSEADQSSVHGALNKIRDLNLTLLYVIR